jgi:energy-coupling factor transport system ATP-binding protein
MSDEIDVTGQGEGIVLHFRTPDVAVKGTIADNACESYMSHLDVLIYEYDGTEYTPFHYERVSASATPSGKVSLHRAKEDFVENAEYKFFVIANSTLEQSAYYKGENIYGEKYNLRELRNNVGLVFQYPEHQLFETDVLTDVCFGPKNQGLSQEECKERAIEALRLVGLPEKYYEVSPFDLSGGQKRRVAIAGVLAMKPKVLVLDEPTAGLDPKGRDEILDQIAYLQKEGNLTVVLVSHSMEDIAKYVDRIVVMNKGSKMFDDEPKKVFAHYEELEKVGLAAPQVTYMMHALAKKGLPIDTEATTIAEAVETISKVLEK